jgi:hypothetical protein
MANAGLIAMKAIQGGILTPEERKELTPALLATLVIGGNIELTAAERPAMPNSLLASLAIGKNIHLSAEELNRLRPEIRMIVEQSLHD